MARSGNESKMREATVRLLETKGFRVRDISSGSGVPKLSRLELTDDQGTFSCVVKTTTGGRISFTREENGAFKVLDDVDHVVHVQPLSGDTTKVRVTMFERDVVRRAFERCWKALENDGNDHLPIWLSPEHEKGLRFVGSGFGTEALWSEIVPISMFESTVAVAPETPPSLEIQKDGDNMMIERIKTTLAKSMGVRPDQIEIEVRVRV